MLLAAVISLFPFTIFSTFLVPIAAAANEETSVVGMLRGLGGVAALVTGIGIAPLIARWSAPHTTAASLVMLSGTSLIATVGTLPTLIVFCVGIGAATAILTPTLLLTATTRYPNRGDSGRAATIVTATQSLAAVLAAPVIGGIALWRGWQGVLWITAIAASILAVFFLRASRVPRAGSAPRLPYAVSFAQLRHRHDLLALVAIAFLRTTAFMGYLAVLAAHYHDRFGLEPTAVTLVWTLSGASFFTGNFLAGRWARGGRRRQKLLLALGLIGAAIALIALFTTEVLAGALIATVLMGFCHAIVAALITTLIAERGDELTAAAYSINAAGMSLGVFTGALLAGAGLAFGGGGAIAWALGIPTLLALVFVPVATGRTAVHNGP
ncbi:MFS transporter [Ruania zhangjianzhongii]|uniref:MFS transporter n=1 Tax=Ruania zhangjianzhongii TaxID=2603206 RepID=UPI00143CFCF0|nr:MFS transporter [Ruania zhangjianzhongii]